MKRRGWNVFVVSMCIAIGTLSYGTAHAGRDWRSDECRYGSLNEGGWTQHEVRLTIMCAASKWSVDGGITRALSVARCESGLQARAYNPNGHAGVYQQDTGSWPGRQNTFGPSHWTKPISESVFNARANVVVSIRMAHADGDWGQWSC